MLPKNPNNCRVKVPCLRLGDCTPLIHIIAQHLDLLSADATNGDVGTGVTERIKTDRLLIGCTIQLTKREQRNIF